MLYCKVAYTGNFGFDYRKTYRAYFHPPRHQFLLPTGAGQDVPLVRPYLGPAFGS